ncbi:MAG: hypothetical protein A4E53_00675 [Pelotomaculum sp. PtaB.Bin104]|nr:MAG: hypothetical protein A4E53_00675 [Pelotomaculum sp. PtaB.Bin104]
MANESSKFTIGQIIYMIISTLVFPAIILSLAGDWFWMEGWIFSIWFLAMTLSVGIYLKRNDPALLAERSKMPGSDNQKGWDKYYQSFAYLSLVVWIIIMPSLTGLGVG